MAKINGTNLAAAVVPFTTDDEFATHLAKYGQGGWQEVATIADRDAITTARREAGMAVFVTTEQTLYILNPDLTSWTEFKSGSTDSVRKTADFANFEPANDGEIVQYIGTTTQNYTQGYFYQAQGHTSTVSSIEFIPREGTETVISISAEDFATFIKTACENNPQWGSDGTNVTHGTIGYYNAERYSFSMYSDSGLICAVSFTIAELEEAGFVFDHALGAQQGVDYACGIDVPTTTYTYSRINVQPETQIVNDVTHTDTDKALSANMGRALQEEINSLSGRGRYLSLWNCATGLAETNPPISPYTYAAGDYFIVNDLADDSISVEQKGGTEVPSVSVNKDTYKAKVHPVTDRVDTFAYTSVNITKNDKFDENTYFVIEDYDKFNAAYAECVTLGNQESINLGRGPVTEVEGMLFRIFDAFGGDWWFAVALKGRNNYGPNQQLNCQGMSIHVPSHECTKDEFKQLIIERLHDYFGMRVVGDFDIPSLYTHEAEVLNFETQSARWTLNNIDLGSETPRNYGVLIGGGPAEIGQIFEVDYYIPRNYKPTGSEYVIDVASTVIETEPLDTDDTYIYDGTVWHLQKNSRVSFRSLSGDPYDNTNLANALDEKITNKATGTGSVSIEGSSAGSTNVVNIGTNSEASGERALALGYGAAARTQDAVQIGEGANYQSGTLQFRNWPLVDNEGKIPEERIPNSVLFPQEHLEDLNYLYWDDDEPVSKHAAIYVGPTNNLYVHDYIYCGTVSLAKPRAHCGWTNEDYLESHEYVQVDQDKLFQKLAEVSQERIDNDDTVHSMVGGDNSNQNLCIYYQVENGVGQWRIDFGNCSFESADNYNPSEIHLNSIDEFEDYGIYIDKDYLNLPTEDSDDEIFEIEYYAPVFCDGTDHNLQEFTVNYMKFMTAMTNDTYGFGYVINNLQHWDYQVSTHTYSMPIIPYPYIWNDSEYDYIEVRFEWDTDNSCWNLLYNGEQIPTTFTTAELESIFGIVINDGYTEEDIAYFGWTFKSAKQYAWKQTNVQPAPEIATITNAEIDEMWS